MNIALTAHHKKLIQKKVRSGSYGSAAEVIREGLRLLEERDERGRRIANLHEEVEKGFIGPGSKWSKKDAERVRNLVQKRAQRQAA